MSVVGRRAAFAITSGAPRLRRRHGYHHSCGDCGSPLFYLADEGDYVSIAPGSFDAPVEIVPLAHQFWPERLPWLALGDDLPKFPGNTLSHPDSRRRPLA